MSCEIYLQSDSRNLDVSFNHAAFSQILERASSQAARAGHSKLSDDFKFAIRMRELYFWDVSDLDRKFFINVLNEISEDSTFFSWIDQLDKDPEIVYQYSNGTNACPTNPREAMKYACFQSVRRLIENLNKQMIEK